MQAQDSVVLLERLLDLLQIILPKVVVGQVHVQQRLVFYEHFRQHLRYLLEVAAVVHFSCLQNSQSLVVRVADLPRLALHILGVNAFEVLYLVELFHVLSLWERAAPIVEGGVQDLDGRIGF